MADLGAPKIEAVVAGCRVLSKAAYNPKIPTCSANKERKKKDPKHTKGGGGGVGGAQVAKHWVCRVLLLGTRSYGRMGKR